GKRDCHRDPAKDQSRPAGAMRGVHVVPRCGVFAGRAANVCRRAAGNMVRRSAAARLAPARTDRPRGAGPEISGIHGTAGGGVVWTRYRTGGGDGAQAQRAVPAAADGVLGTGSEVADRGKQGIAMESRGYGDPTVSLSQLAVPGGNIPR